MELSIEDAGRPCQKCTLPLSYLTFDRSHEGLLPVTITSCSNCGHISWQDEIETKQPIKNDAIG